MKGKELKNMADILQNKNDIVYSDESINVYKRQLIYFSKNDLLKSIEGIDIDEKRFTNDLHLYFPNKDVLKLFKKYFDLCYYIELNTYRVDKLICLLYLLEKDIIKIDFENKKIYTVDCELTYDESMFKSDKDDFNFLKKE